MLLHRYTLPNGLRVVHLHDTRTAMVAVDVMYNVGARDENRALTGIAHLFEHLMFGGSENEPDFNGALERAGGVNNAWTSSDFTNFYDIVPAQNVESALRVESDRMLALSFNPEALRVQRSVVVEEFKETVLNRPYGRLMHELRSMLYHPDHPYSWPVIGLEPAHIERVTDTDIRQWFYAHYAPNNAVLAVVGAVEPEHLRKLIEKWFADIPRRDIAPRKLPRKVWADTTAEPRVVGDNVPASIVVMGFPMAAYGQPGYTEADILTDILSAGRSARLTLDFSERNSRLLTDAEASIIGSEHEGILLADCRVVAEGADAPMQARDALLKELQRLAEPGGITQHELERAINRYEARRAADSLSPVGMARHLASAEIHGEHPDIDLQRRREVTTAALERVAREIFVDSVPATLIITPEANGEA